MGMDINIQAFQGVPTKSLGAGTKPQAASDQIGGLLVSELLPRYSPLAYASKLFSAANPTGITATALVSGTTTVFLGFGLSNPVGSLVNLHVLKAGYACSTPPAAAAPIVIAFGFNSGTNVTHTTPLLVRNNNVGGIAGTGLADSSFTVPTAPNVAKIIGTLGTGAITTIGVSGFEFDTEGAIMLPPGGYMIIAALVAAGASGAFASATWAELPL